MIDSTNIKTRKFFTEAIKKIAISTQREELLYTIAQKITIEYQERTNNFGINFICTHNSRRSQLAQVWTFFAIDYFNLDRIIGYSGGTEATSFHRNTVKTLQKTGFSFSLIDFSHKNPKYSISFKNAKKTLTVFSKLYDDVSNSQPYIAITTCSHADEDCPFISNAIHRFHLPFVDPKSYDNSFQEEEKYFTANQQIAGEIFLLFKKVKELIS